LKDKDGYTIVSHSGKESFIPVASSAAQALGHISDKQAVEPLIDALRDESSVVRAGAAIALGKIGDTRAIGPLIEALKAQPPNVVAAGALMDLTGEDLGEDSTRWEKWFKQNAEQSIDKERE
jgi:HEAT repeat protein